MVKLGKTSKEYEMIANSGGSVSIALLFVATVLQLQPASARSTWKGHELPVTAQVFSANTLLQATEQYFQVRSVVAPLRIADTLHLWTCNKYIYD